MSKVEARLTRDENSWLKLIGEVGDVARMLLELRKLRQKDNQRIKALESYCARLEEKIARLEESHA